MERIQGKGYFRQQTQKLAGLSRIFDASIIFGLLWWGVSWYTPTHWNSEYSFLAALAVLAFYLISEFGGIYRSWRGVPFRMQFFQLLLVWGGVVLTLLFLASVTKTSSNYSRMVILVWLVSVPAVLSLWRLLLRGLLSHLRAQGYNTRTVAIVGAGELGVRVAQKINHAPWLGLNLLGFFDDRAYQEARLSWDGQIQGDFDDLVEKARRGEVDLIYIALPLTAQPRIMDLVSRLADTTVSLYLVPDFFVSNLFHGQWTSLAGLPMVSVFDTPFWGVEGWLKRAQDIVLSSLILCVIALPMLLIAIAVKLSSPGPVLFKQLRYGIDGKPIKVWKFRSMRVLENGDKVVQATRNDPRVTPLGAFLRRTSLDELPQFINVLMGDMSIVGPRPHAVAHNEEYRALIKGYMLRHAVKPGITGWAQINGWRGETDTLDKMEKRVEHDLWYIRNWSFWLDLKIVFLTLFRGFVGKFAY